MPAQYVEATAALVAQYACASFCSREGLERWRCGAPCEAAPALHSPAARFLGPGHWFDVQGFVARLPRSDAAAECVVAFRGTQDNNLGNLARSSFAHPGRNFLNHHHHH